MFGIRMGKSVCGVLLNNTSTLQIFSLNCTAIFCCFVFMSKLSLRGGEGRGDEKKKSNSTEERPTAASITSLIFLAQKQKDTSMRRWRFEL